MEFIASSVAETEQFAKELVKKLEPGNVVLLRGDLGAGKTALVKAVVKALGESADDVVSPTFTIVNQYRAGGMDINHFDLYRIKDPNELINIGIEEYLYSSAITFVEWPERAPEIFDMPVINISIEKLGQTKRKFAVSGV